MVATRRAGDIFEVSVYCASKDPLLTPSLLAAGGMTPPVLALPFSRGGEFRVNHRSRCRRIARERRRFDPTVPSFEFRRRVVRRALQVIHTGVVNFSP